MTLKYMQGFETMRDDSDFRSQGFAASNTGRKVAFVPSASGVAGTSLALLGSNPNTTTIVPGTTSSVDPGYLNTGITVNQAWLAGGFTFGCGAKFNGGVAAYYGAGSTSTTSNTNAVCFDGTLYWAIQTVGSTFAVTNSPDLKTWTAVSVQPTTLNSSSSISYVGNNTIAVGNVGSVNATMYTTTNGGASWTSTLLSGSTGTASVTSLAAATGNPDFPHVTVTVGSPSTASTASFFIIKAGTLGGTMTNVVSPSQSTGSVSTARLIGTIKIINGMMVVTARMSSGTTITYSYIAMAPISSIGTAASWTTATFNGTASIPIVNDILFNAASNLYVVATDTGMQTVPNGAGTAGVANQLASGAITYTSRYTTTEMRRVFMVGSTMVAVGLTGQIISSNDGITWTQSGGHLIPQGGTYGWSTALYDGSRYVLFSDATSGMIATTPDLQTNYQAQYVMEAADTGAIAYSVLGPMSASAVSTSGSTFTFVASMALQPSTTTGANRTIALSQSATAYVITTSVAFSPMYHYYEIKATANATTNAFSYQLYVDGILAGTSPSAYQLGSSTTDTTSVILIQFPRSGSWTVFDDIYFTLDDKVANTLQGPIGIVNIIAQRPSTDIQDTWVKSGNASTNAGSVNQSALSSVSTNYVSSVNSGDKDIYGTTDMLPAGYAPKAVMNEAYFTRTSTSIPVVNVGTLSGSTEIDGTAASISAATATYVNQVVERDPNGNVAWTAASVNSAKFVLNHTT